MESSGIGWGGKRCDFIQSVVSNNGKITGKSPEPAPPRYGNNFNVVRAEVTVRRPIDPGTNPLILFTDLRPSEPPERVILCP